MKKLFASVLFAVLAVAYATAAGNAEGSGPLAGKTVGFSQMENNDTWRLAQTKSMQDTAKRLGVRLVFADANSSTPKQASDVENMVAQGVDYIVLAPREMEGMQSALDAAKAAGIPVIVVDREVSSQDYRTNIVADFIKEGNEAGKWLINKTGGQANVVVLETTPGSSVAIDRQKGFEQAIAGTNVKIIAQQTANSRMIEAQQVMENIIQARGDEITAVYAHNDDMAMGAIQALKAAGMIDKVTVVGIDGTRNALQAIIRGEMGATYQCSPFYGPIVFEVIARLEAGEDVERKIINGGQLFDASNARANLSSAF